MTLLRKLAKIIFFISFLYTVHAIHTNYAFAEDKMLTIFSGRKEPLIKPVISLFESETGIKVILKTGKSTSLGQQILQELPHPTADIYIAKESGSLEYLRLKNAFEPYTSRATEKIPNKFKARDGTWIGVSGRSRAVIYNTDMMDRGDVPTTLDELSLPKYKGIIAAVNASNESFVAWVTALILDQGFVKTEKYLNALKKNNIQLLSKSHTDIRKAVGRGEYPLGLINHYYYHLQRHETDMALTHVGIIYLDQEGARGELINVSGAAIVKGARHKDEARKFIDFLTSAAAQKKFAEVNFEYPLLPGVKSHPEVLEALNCRSESAIDCLHVMNVNLDAFGPQWEKTIQLLDKVGWY